ncbi:hypothetical protein [Povalibacter sp.]|uniref:hypothetical protein n=1 Tax=Povalibacter sp. TaxID=1962978 RepID=UPI002F41E339
MQLTGINGTSLRNTENHVHQLLARYHPFGCDDLIHETIPAATMRTINRFAAQALLRKADAERKDRCGIELMYPRLVTT